MSFRHIIYKNFTRIDPKFVWLRPVALFPDITLMAFKIFHIVPAELPPPEQIILVISVRWQVSEFPINLECILTVSVVCSWAYY